MTRAERRAHWRAITENQATSSMSVAAYCREAPNKTILFLYLAAAQAHTKNRKGL